MTPKRLLIHTSVLFLLPVIVAWFGVSIAGAVALVLLMLIWRWLLTMSGLSSRPQGPAYQLDTISASHFVEKVRWCMDRLGLEYAENQAGATLGAFFLGRTVPRLRIRTGAVETSIGNSPEILRYLWGMSATVEADGTFLQPTAERLALEEALDRYGRNLQVWIYHHLPRDRELMIHAWGANSPLVPAWQRLTLRVLYPLLTMLIRRAFAINQRNYERAVERIETLLSDTETRLADGRRSITGDERINYTDIAFAALSGLWLMPEGYGGGKADAVRLDRDRLPQAMRADVERWIEDYPRVVIFVEDLYASERRPKPSVM